MLLRWSSRAVHTLVACLPDSLPVLSNCLFQSCLLVLLNCLLLLRVCLCACFVAAGAKMDAVIGAVPKSTLVQTVEKYME